MECYLVLKFSVSYNQLCTYPKPIFIMDTGEECKPEQLFLSLWEETADVEIMYI